MKKTMYWFILAAVFALVLAGCANPDTETIIKWVEEELPPNGGGPDDEPPSQTAQRFIVDAVAGLSHGADDAQPGAVVATLVLPVYDGPWTPALVTGADHNQRFSIRDVDDTDNEDELVDTWEVVIGETALDWGYYRVSIVISNEEGTTFNKAFAFVVSKTPALFKKAPSVYPHIVTPGKNKLTILWESVSGAAGYYVYLGTTDTQPATALQTVTDANVLEVTDIEGDATDGGLPDSTTYYVWVEAYNGAGTSLSPSAQRKTTDPVQSYWWDGVDRHDCLFGDYYKFTQTSIEYGPGLGYTGEILYHSAWTEADSASWPQATKGKHDEQFTGRPQGVFVIKYGQDDDAARAANQGKEPAQRTKLYSAVYYWGMAIPAWHPDHQDKNEAYAVNQWASYAERTSFEEAIDFFTCAKVRDFIKVAADPYIRFMED